MPMLRPADVPLVIYQGVDYRDAFRVGDAAAGVYTNTTGWTARLEVSPEGVYTDPPAVLLTTENDGIAVGVDGVTEAETTLSVAAAAGATTVTVASVAGISVGDRIDIALAGGMLAVATTWVQEIDGTVVTLRDALPGVAEAGGAVWVTDPAWFGMYNLLLYLSAAATSALVPWGEGVYTLDLIDPYGRATRLAQSTAVLQEGDAR